MIEIKGIVRCMNGYWLWFIYYNNSHIAVCKSVRSYTTRQSCLRGMEKFLINVRYHNVAVIFENKYNKVKNAQSK